MDQSPSEAGPLPPRALPVRLRAAGGGLLGGYAPLPPSLLSGTASPASPGLSRTPSAPLKGVSSQSCRTPLQSAIFPPLSLQCHQPVLVGVEPVLVVCPVAHCPFSFFERHQLVLVRRQASPWSSAQSHAPLSTRAAASSCALVFILHSTYGFRQQPPHPTWHSISGFVQCLCSTRVTDVAQFDEVGDY